jgi:uncharacterized Zn-finger protein
MSHTAGIDELGHSEPALSYTAPKIYWPKNTTCQPFDNIRPLSEGQANFPNLAVRRDSVGYSNPQISQGELHILDNACQSRKTRDISRQLSTTSCLRPQPVPEFASTSPVPILRIPPSNRRGRFRCSECQKSYSRRGWLKTHLRDAHLMEQKYINSTIISKNV